MTQDAVCGYSSLPDPLQQCAEQYWQQLLNAQPQLIEKLDNSTQSKIKYCFALSDFVAQSCVYQSGLLTDIFTELEPQQLLSHYGDKISSLVELDDENGFMTQIRLLRKTLMAHIAVLDLCQLQSIDQSYLLISQLSDLLIEAAYLMAYRQISKVFGTPKNADGTNMPMIILGMGKLGGRELNFSSDIDLIFCYGSAGQTIGGRKVIDNQMFFTKVAQKLIHYLHHKSAAGAVFRVDMRLRPFGDSGPLVLSFNAMEDYYQQQGRDWERYAMLKSRVVVEPCHPDAVELIEMLRPFVYRRYIDFSVIDSLRKMKQMIAKEARRKGGPVNIKLGMGGIREVEFIAQALQLIRGGREKQLQVRPLLEALEQLKQIGELSASQHECLKQQYLFLRTCEHYLQQFSDQQTQLLPVEELDQQRLCVLFAQDNWHECHGLITEVMAKVHQEFYQIIAAEEETPDQSLSDFELLWQWVEQANADSSQQLSVLDWLSQDKGQLFIERLIQFNQDCQKRAIGGRGKDVLDKLIPQLLADMEGAKEQLETLERVLNVLEKIATRTAYLELLHENSGALAQLVKLCARSVWIAEQLAIQPILLDELIDPRILYNPPPLPMYQTQLDDHMMRVPEDDMEQQLESLRHFKLSHQLRIAAADITGVLDIAKVSDHLTALSEAIMDNVVSIAWKQMTERYGEPAGRSLTNKGFGVIAYGKMGGEELGYDSDLDVVFVHNCGENEVTHGKKSIDSRQFYLKLSQRIVHIFTSRTVSGVLYQIDNRLRPQGNSGLLACHINTYEAYLAEEAWTWEHQALVRTRMVYGDDALMASFNHIRNKILCQVRQLQQLKTDVVEMRKKMRDNLAKDTPLMFDLKQGVGGIADIEFITQYLVLAYSSKYPQLSGRCNNNELFGLFAELAIITQAQSQTLAQAYQQLRNMYHHLTLQRQDKLAENQQMQELSGKIQQIWQLVFE